MLINGDGPRAIRLDTKSKMNEEKVFEEIEIRVTFLSAYFTSVPFEPRPICLLHRMQLQECHAGPAMQELARTAKH